MYLPAQAKLFGLQDLALPPPRLWFIRVTLRGGIKRHTTQLLQRKKNKIKLSQFLETKLPLLWSLPSASEISMGWAGVAGSRRLY